jgi:hypothetical protein
MDKRDLTDHAAIAELKAALQKSEHFFNVEVTIGTRCLIPDFDGALFSAKWSDALWARFSMGAPLRLRQSVERYSIVKRA